MAFYTFNFEAVMVRHLIGKGERKLAYSVVLLPDGLRPELPFEEHPRLRVEGELNGHPFNGAWQPAGNGRYFLMVPKPIIKADGLSVGDDIELRFNIADQNEVAVPPALLAALRGQPDLLERWNQLTAGKQRGFAHRVASAKAASTIAKRVDEVVHMVREGLSYGKGGSIR